MRSLLAGILLLTAPAIAQQINPKQILGTWIAQTLNSSQTISGTLDAQVLNKAYHASAYSGSDVGMKINAADADAGSDRADIVVNVTGTVSTVPVLHSNHRLLLNVPLTWTVAPIVFNNTQILGNGSKAVQRITSSSIEWMHSSNLTNFAMSNVWFSNSITGSTDELFLSHCRTCKDITFTGNHFFGIGGLFTDSTALTYAGVNSGNLSQNVIFCNNFMDGGTNGVLTLANFHFTQNVIASNNMARNSYYGLVWWGGNAVTNGANPSNPRWSQNISITGGTFTNMRAAVWGGMGQNITVTGITADGCSDVCLDAESSTNVSFTGFSLKNSVAGAIGVFFDSHNVTFGSGVISSDTASGMSSMFLYNASFDPKRSTNIKVHDVKFICNDASTVCQIVSDPIGNLEFVNNTLANTKLVMSSTNSSGYRISGNLFLYTHAVPTFSAITIPGSVHAFLPDNYIEGNRFVSFVTQPRGTFAINAAITDPDYPDRLHVSDNATQGFSNDATFNANSSNADISPTFIFRNNVWKANSVAKVKTGVLGTFQGYDVDATTDQTNITGKIKSVAGYEFKGTADGSFTMTITGCTIVFRVGIPISHTGVSCP